MIDLLIHIIIPLAIFSFIALFTLFAVYAERKIAGFVQDRLGPMETGKYGLLQTIADILKLLQKEFITPGAADKVLFALAPVIIFSAVFIGFSVMPWAPGFIPADTTTGLFFIMAVVSIDAIGILMAGWGSNNKYSLLGAIRAIAQMVSYEIPVGLSLIAAVMITQTLNLNDIAFNQGILATEQIYFFGLWNVTKVGGFFAWNILQAPHLIVVYLIFFIASLAECNRAPFDIPEAESELIGGFHTEYGGIRFAFVFLAEYAMMFLVAMLGVVIFLGGWNTPLPNIGALKLAEWTTGLYWGIFWTLTKSLFIVGVQMWIRWTLPRFRADQLMNLCWKVMIPIAFLCMAISGIWRILVMV
ncbi:NADH-quinone oxidoreductase subunit NuoH [Sphingobacterium alkalisoli]|uniref:NADH-quinone oxidoreductase subunit H n=1 Tax=Sphingobacterium alkalisoli TaxID=1874115 RepID=A0A4U0GYC7_9SPHI|nr:NADH-quinone oxidoreductase subunit NuoH [Sphingobacterium alkalisoli]TJY64210.1 NADH-quinone oxidoreductase subunit NuoH [Sphingobacterium alkalisoli]GGH23155.1 NADH-quinone oxidoreductase subunit H [Sphingobacterium alkalisoli]